MSVSIVINNYNYAPYLKECIDSALSQSVPAREVIVVDDGSTDGSREVIAGYGDRVRAIFQENGGQAAAFNTGIRAAQSEWVWLLDADDRLLPEAIGEAWERVRPGLVRLAMGMREINAEGREVGLRLPNGGNVYEGELWTVMLEGRGMPSVPTSGNLFSREVLLRILPVPEQAFRICADAYLFVMSAKHGPIRIDPVVTADYRVHGQNNFHRGPSSHASPGALRKELENVLLTLDLLEEYAETVSADTAARIRKYWLGDQALLAILRARVGGVEHPALGEWSPLRILGALLSCLLTGPKSFALRYLKFKQALGIWLRKRATAWASVA